MLATIAACQRQRRGTTCTLGKDRSNQLLSTAQSCRGEKSTFSKSRDGILDLGASMATCLYLTKRVHINAWLKLGHPLHEYDTLYGRGNIFDSGRGIEKCDASEIAQCVHRLGLSRSDRECWIDWLFALQTWTAIWDPLSLCGVRMLKVELCDVVGLASL